MSNRLHNQLRERLSWNVLLVATGLVMAFAQTSVAQTIKNLHQLTQAFNVPPQLRRGVDIEVTVCAASRAKVGVLIVQDDTGVELLQLGDLGRDVQPGEQLSIRHADCFLRKRDMGIEISASPLINNDGLHAWTSLKGETILPEGMIPVRVDWFNYWRTFGLNLVWAVDHNALEYISDSNLWHSVVTESGATKLVPGLRAECYEGSWDAMPDFNLLKPMKTCVTTNFDLGIRPHDERVGVRFSGYLKVTRAGTYQFSLSSDDGSLLFLGPSTVPVLSLGRTNVLPAKSIKLQGSDFSILGERHWITIEGRVSFVSRVGEGLKFDLGTDRNVVSVQLADTAGLDPNDLMNARVSVTGIGRSVIAGDQTPVLGKLFVANAHNVILIEPGTGQNALMLPITSVAQVRGLPIEHARQSMPVRIRGTVTGAINASQERWMSFQDDTRGIFVRLAGISNAAPAFGELWEVQGHSGAGDFAPIVVAERITRLGEGLLPSPIKPTWAELLNGSRDVQWAELTGLVTDVRTNKITLQLPEGRLEVELEGRFEPELKQFLKAVVRIRGVLYAVWDAASREVRVGHVMMRSSAVTVDVPAPTDPFDAVLRTPRELLLFDAQASPFRPVKVRGQVVYADSTQVFLEADRTGLRLLPVGKVDLRPGDLVEAVGYPDIGRVELLLRESLLRKTGEAPLPDPKVLDESGIVQQNLNSTRVRVEGKLLGWHVEQGSLVCELQSGKRLYMARIVTAESAPATLRVGSSLALVGVYVGRDFNRQIQNSDNESFELLLNSAADITVISQPSWWTLPRLFALLGVLLVILVFTVIWNTQLRRQVEQRTDQLQHEIGERERLEHQHALETERSRIARDLHDDLGASLTEITVLANTGQLPQANTTGHSNLFQAISHRARGLVSALDVIVWAVDPEDNTLQSLADYLTGYTNDFFSHTQIACRFKVPVSCPAITLEGRVRHDLLLVAKEALNNIVRHANATEVEFRLSVTNSVLEIDVADNGKGIENGSAGSGHGLKNLSARLKNLGGDCQIESRPSGGTIVKIRLPLPATTGSAVARR